MNKGRRNFIKTGGLAVTAAAFLPGMAFRQGYKAGLALYTIRDKMNVIPATTLKEVAAIGYTWLETADYRNRKFYGFSPADFRALLAGKGMEPISAHIGVRQDTVAQAAGDCAMAGIKYLVLPSLGREYYKDRAAKSKTAAMLRNMGEICRKAGIKFAYHNHAFEFAGEGEERFYDILLKETDAGVVDFEVDLYWMVYAGVDPVDYFNRYPGRFPLWHVKDMKDNDTRSFAVVGEGMIDYKRLFRYGKQAGMKYFFVEQDRFEDYKPMEGIRRSYEYLQRNRL